MLENVFQLIVVQFDAVVDEGIAGVVLSTGDSVELGTGTELVRLSKDVGEAVGMVALLVNADVMVITLV